MESPVKVNSPQPASDLLELLLGPDNNEEGGVKKVTEKNAMTTLHKVVAFLRASGESVETIAEKVDLTLSELELLLNQPHMQNLVLSAQVSMGMPLQARLKSAAETAFEKRYKLMHSGDERIVEKVTESFLDRYLGKATQLLETRNYNFNANVDIESIDKDIESSKKRLEMLEHQQKLLDASYNK